MNSGETLDPEDIEVSEEEVSEEEVSEEEVSEETINDEEAYTVPLEQYEKIKDDYLRLAADFENFKKRAEKEKSMSMVSSLSMIISTLLPLIDNFEIAMNQDGTPKEIEALYKMTQVFLDTFNVKEVPGTGEPFDPSYHEAVEQSGEGDIELVGEVLRKGYEIDGRLLRPAMVKVHSE
ncbi:nucleotide exchange factor GrpE [Acidimicrobiia bacterium]|nr:nucleotide exchange factor GrpE [Acidimicrobiia bacterium]